MVIKEVTLTKPDGMQNRDCAALSQRAMSYASEVFLECGTRKVNLKSVMGIISLGLKAGAKMVLITKGDDEEAAAAEIARMFENNFK